ncbi:MAG: glutamate formimidoyltransferase [Crocinitomicaceae bacterium]|nr:glutamate formimidoyltransferase [Crocinitomicaceae bacterium]|tara:strand:+ start:489 stop:2180 length:1692 start_codon:yes stop_codon:yes gene_type:complete
MQRLIECVPNISEGRRPEIIDAVTSVVETVEGCRLLDVDPGKSTNRTVITFVGPPETIGEAAFRVIEKAAELIDMSKHAGEHPRMGATDVCPFVPISGVTMEDCIQIAHALGKRVGEELGIPGYHYESAAHTPERKNLAYCRKGEYEGLEKLSSDEFRPDFGPTAFNDRAQKTGATAIGARDFLVAYNININSTSSRRANAIAFDIREAGRIKREGGKVSGKIMKDANGAPIRQPGTLKAVKGIGWYIEEYGIAQLSLNLTDINVTPTHVAFDEACSKAQDRGIRVTGSELVGLVPLKVMTDAADYFLRKQQRSTGVSESEKIKIAIKSLGLDDLAPFNPDERIIEYLIGGLGSFPLLEKNLREFSDETASESPAPGGGSIAAYSGALGTALSTMVANLSANKRGWDDRWEEFSNWADKGQNFHTRLLELVDADTAAFNGIMDAYGLPKSTEDQKVTRDHAIQAATKHAIEIPMQVAEIAHDALEVAEAMADFGNPNSITDAGVGAMCLRTAVLGAILNARVNTSDLNDKAYVVAVLSRCEELVSSVTSREAAVLARVDELLG